MSRVATDKIVSARNHWHQTIGEWVLRVTGVLMSLVVMSIALRYGLEEAIPSPISGKGHAVIHDPVRAEKHVRFVYLSEDDIYLNEARTMMESIASYQGVKVTAVQGDYQEQPLDSADDVIFVLGAQDMADEDALVDFIVRVREQDIPLYWVGSGFSIVSHLYDITFNEEGISNTPPNTTLNYNGVEIAAPGLPYVRGDISQIANVGNVLATIKLHHSFNRQAIVQYQNLIYSAFNPFSRSYAPLALSITMDSLSSLLGEHAINPRIIFRLEDINGVEYGNSDTSFSSTATYLLDQEVFIHIGVIPAMVDSEGKLEAEIDQADSLLKLVKENPKSVGIIQHGYMHYRKDPRNAGLRSGTAYEFFYDDDATLGFEEAERFAREVITNGYKVLAKNGLTPSMFEAPHYVMSQAEQRTAEEMFSLMQHPPLFFHEGGPRGFFLPWLTQRSGTVYVPSSAGYVNSTDPESVNKILGQLEVIAKIMPDPVVVVFFHPFIQSMEGREADLEALIQGIKKMDYRFVNTLDQVRKIPPEH